MSEKIQIWLVLEECSHQPFQQTQTCCDNLLVIFLSSLIFSHFSPCSDSLRGSDTVEKNDVFVPVMAAKCNGGVITAAALEYGSIGNGAYPGLPFVCNVSEKVSPINKNT